MPVRNKICIIWFFGIISGFTLNISGSTLNFWLAKENINIQLIGIFALITLPYSINFIWAPVLDIYKIKYLSLKLGNRLAWLCSIQLLLALFVLSLGYFGPSDYLLLFAIISFIVSFLSSTQDTILGAIRTEIIPKESHGVVAGIYIFGYRIGMLISSAGAICLSVYIGWHVIYMIFAGIILLFIILLIIFKHSVNNNIIEHSASPCSLPDMSDGNNRPVLKNKNSGIKSILTPIGSWQYIILVIIFLIFYRLPDDFINIMIYPFLLHLEYSEFEIAGVGKSFGIIIAIIGGLIASLVMKKTKIIDGLLIFGILHAIAHSLFILQELYGHNVKLLFLVMGFESLTGGMAMSTYIAFITSLCSGKFRATQYAFFTAMMGVSRSSFPILSGYIVTLYGWKNFFSFVTFATIPSLVLIFKLAKMIKQREKS